MKQDKFQQTNYKIYMISGILCFLIFATISFNNIKQHVNKSYDNIKEYSLDLSKSYARRLSNSRVAVKIISELLDEKMYALAELVLESDLYLEYQDLQALAKKYKVKEINVYDLDGVIANSNFVENIGWQSYEGHPAYEFIHSDLEYLSESIRESVISGEENKYSHFKNAEGYSVQIVISAQQFHDFLSQFTIDQLIKDAIDSKFVENIFFTDTEYNLIATGNDSLTNIYFTKDELHRHFESDEIQIGRSFLGNEMLHVCAPVFYQEERIGTLTVVWSEAVLTSEYFAIISESVLRFTLITTLFGVVLALVNRSRKESVQLAFYDTLTGLPNTNYFKDYLEPIIKEAHRRKAAILLLDIENLNILDQTYGHDHRDSIIQQMAEFYRSHLNEEDPLFRLEADKFAIVFRKYSNINVLKDLALLVLNDFNSPKMTKPKYDYLNLKIVIYEITERDLTIDKILQDLSVALGSLEGEKQGGIVVFNPGMREAIFRQEKIENAIIDIIDGRNEDYLHMHYQPLYSLRSNKIVALEALARMTIPELGNIPPLEFIEIAEKRNLIFQLGNKILEKTLQIYDQNEHMFMKDIRVGVNISPSQLLRSDFFETIKAMRAANPEKWEHIVFEITESVLMENFYLANYYIEGFSKLGILIALDDFGTGFSSLAELHNMNINIIKIDKSFIDRIGKDKIVITEDIIAMSQRLGLTVIAEGVETEEQLNYLIDHKCNMVQGYYFSRPMPLSEIKELLIKQKDQENI